tara:strand:- start:751 stop:1476 length:726 start_codon:yes stop_codon:yes gene_type:complete
MKISQAELRRIVVEEYIKEEGLEESQAAQDLLRQILGDEEYERRQALKNRGSRGGDTAPMEKPHQAASDTMALDTGDDPAPSSENLEDQISNLVKGMQPDDVADLFQAVFARIPGVEMGDAEEEPETLYSPGAEGRPQISLGPLREAVFQKIVEMGSYGLRSMAGIPGARDEEEEVDEGEYRDMEDEGEMYDALDPHGFDKMSDAELIEMAEKEGIEEILVVDLEGDLANREEVIAALKNV